MSLSRRILQEPLLHFLLLGALVFIVFAVTSEPEPEGETGKVVRITDAQVAQIADMFEETWRRRPTRDELDNMLAAQVREDVLVQEAAALSLDVDDAVIRRRLAQKMEFLITSSAGAQIPSEDALRAFFDERAEDYASAPAVAFEQVFLGADATQEQVSSTLDALKGGRTPGTVGRPTLLPAAVSLSARNPVDGTFGSGFFDAVMALEAGEWVGPVTSGFGVHVVRLSNRNPGAIPEFDEVRSEVEADWRRVESDRISEEIVEELRAGYDVVLPDPDALQALTE